MKYSLVVSAACISGASLVSSAPTPNHATGSHNPAGRPYAHDDAAYSNQRRESSHIEPTAVKQSISDNQVIPRSLSQNSGDIATQVPRPDASRVDSELTASATRKDVISERGYSDVSGHDEEDTRLVRRKSIFGAIFGLVKGAGRAITKGGKPKSGPSAKPSTSKRPPKASSGAAQLRNLKLGKPAASPSMTQRARMSSIPNRRNPSSSAGAGGGANVNNFNTNFYDFSSTGGRGGIGTDPQYAPEYGSDGYEYDEDNSYGNGGFGGGNLARRALAPDSPIIARQTQTNIVSRDDLEIDRLD